jgi:hypothetical protein
VEIDGKKPRGFALLNNKLQKLQFYQDRLRTVAMAKCTRWCYVLEREGDSKPARPHFSVPEEGRKSGTLLDIVC